MEGLTEEERLLVNRTARESMKLKILADIRADMIVCGMEGWDMKEYIRELQSLINHFKV